MTISHNRLLAMVLCAALPSCAALPTPADTSYLPPGVFGVYEDNATGALNLAVWAFAAPRRTQGSPIDGARAVVAVEYLADELRGNPRWIGLSAESKLRMVLARMDTR